jgi:putative inorganic carbon (hco3(-)) transporter
MERLTFNIRSSPRGPVLVAGGRTARAAKASARLVRVRRGLAAARERYDWDYLWMLAFTALLFFRPQDHLAALESFHLAELTAIAGLAAMAVRRLHAGQPLVKINAEVIAVVLLGAIIVITIPFSIWPTGSLTVFTEIYVKIILIFALMMSTITTPRRLRQMTLVMITASGYIAGRGVIDYVSGVNLVEGDRLGGAVGGMFKNPNDLALNLVTFLAPTLFVIIHEERTPRRVLAALVAVLIFVATIFTKSRSGFLGLIAMGAVVTYYTARVKPTFVFAVVIAGVLALPAMPASFWNRMDSIMNPEEDTTGSRAARIRLLNQGFAVFTQNPLTGVGAGQFQNYNGPEVVEKWRVTHNVWLQVAAELGIFGLLTFAFLVARAYSSCFAALRMLKRPRRRRAGYQQATATDAAVDQRTAGDQSAALPQPSAVRNRQAPPPNHELSEEDRRILEINAKSMMAGLVGWTICALFASVAFNWTFYYVLALAVAGREIVASRREAPQRESNAIRASGLVRVHA